MTLEISMYTLCNWKTDTGEHCASPALNRICQGMEASSAVSLAATSDKSRPRLPAPRLDWKAWRGKRPKKSLLGRATFSPQRFPYFFPPASKTLFQDRKKHLRGLRGRRSAGSSARRSRHSRSHSRRGRSGSARQAARATGLDGEARRVIDGAGGVSDADVDGSALGQVDGPGVRVASDALGDGGQGGGRGLTLGDGGPVGISLALRV